MLRLALALSLGSALLLSLSSCDFEKPEPVCSFLCGGENADACPDGYTCVEGADEMSPSFCVRDDLAEDGSAICNPDAG